MRIIVSGGGTAGHVIPLLAVVAELKRQRHKILYLGAGEPESKLVKIVQFKRIVAGKWRRYAWWQNLLDPLKVLIGVIQALAIFNKFQPDVVLVKGGYVSLPVVIAAAIGRKKLYAHESDIVIGWTNRLAARFAKKVFVGFPIDYYREINKNKLIYAGTPVRYGLSATTSANDKQKFGLKNNLPVIVVTGGSQGARALNRLVFSGLKDMLNHYQIIHLTGVGDFKQAIEIKNRLPASFQERYKIYQYLENEFGSALKVADLVVTRGGATSLAEIAVAKKPAIVIPLPSAAADHQRKNAEFYRDQYGYLLLVEASVNTSYLGKAIDEMLAKKLEFPKPLDSTKIIIDNLV